MRSIFSVALFLVLTAPLTLAQTTSYFGVSTVVGLGTGNAWAPTLSTDGLEIIFSSNRTGGVGRWDLWTAKRTGIDKAWGAPTNLTALNSTVDDFEPNLSADGLELFFVSNRTGKTGVTDVMVSTRLAPPLPWSAPKFVAGSINALGKAIDDPALTQDGLKIFYTVGVKDIYFSTRASTSSAWANETAFAPANNMGAGEHSPTPHANGNIVVFASDKAGGTGSADFYITFYNTTTKAWSTPTELKELNRTTWDSNASFVDITGQIYWSDWTSGGPVVRCACYKLASIFVDHHPATGLDPFTRGHWPTPSGFGRRGRWGFGTTATVTLFDCHKVTTWFLGLALKRSSGIPVPGLIGSLELDPVTLQLYPFPGKVGLPFALPILVPKAGSFPPGTTVEVQGFGIEGATIISTDPYQVEVR